MTATRRESPEATGLRLPGWLARTGPLAALLVLVVVLAFLSPHFLTVRNMFNIFQQISVLAILALGSTAVIISAGIDLSVGSILGLAGIVAGWAFVTAGMPMGIAILLALAAASAVGFLNGAMITAGRLPPFIATLATLSAARGMALVVSDGRPISGFPAWFRAIGTFDILGVVPLSVVLVAVLYLAGGAYLRYRPSGRAVYAIGGNQEVARLSGIRIGRELLKIYTIAGLLSGVGGLVLAARLNSAQPTAGTAAELDVIAAVVIGGASLAGGSGAVSRTLVGALIIGVLRNGLNLLNVSPFWQQIAIGAVIAVAVMTDTLRKRKQ